MSDILLNFEDGLGSYLTKDQLREQAPLVFADAPTNPDVSKKYLFVNTETIIDDLDKLGWKPVEAAQRKSIKKEGTIFSKHMVAFQNPDIKITSGDGDDAYPRILLTNSHDGMQAFKFSVGIFRLVCSNGLVVADEQFSDFKIKHKGYTFGELRKVVRQAVEDLPNKVQIMNDMKNRILTRDEKNKLALDAMLIRAGVAPGSEQAEAFNYDDETIDDILDPKRDADKGNDLWRVFNVVQEKITQGDFHAALTGAKVRKVRKIKSFEKDIKVNKELFKLATALV
jgi:hypothetical protein|tara:strand:- start:283 stop:1131 length:849 start_codon:yes stop_codon:yes gene_type:complete